MFSATRRATFALLFLLVSGVTETSRAVPPPRPVVELSHRDGVGPTPTRGSPADAEFVVDVTVYADGTWIAGDRHGQLTPQDRARLVRAARVRPALETRRMAMCQALPTGFHRVRTQRGVLTWLAPCSRSPNVQTSALIELVYTLTTRDEQVPLPLEEPAPVVVPPPATDDTVLVAYAFDSMRRLDEGERLVLRADGRVEGLATEGRVAEEGMRELRRMIATVVVARGPIEHACAAALTGEASIDVRGRGRLRWSTPCGSVDPSIGALLRRIRELAR